MEGVPEYATTVRVTELVESWKLAELAPESLKIKVVEKPTVAPCDWIINLAEVFNFSPIICF